ncbi:putative epoxide hydrolase [Hyphomonas neptunium ATCC 15444]|uniref:Putative epoxide hydrolase n=2 Tax=Hyphomonas TaxID=85 RepID=Q0BYL3_HYPNA|nr:MULTISPECIES: alpha/beta hydrolase [Hyphomonas]ABI78770.1 putative epoxide hydrolase [Hyphomonas neptunium ATCC 15444]KCZ91556.1 putative epoxide hydrolase [Hyphomonas hirschiana VP5]
MPEFRMIDAGEAKIRVALEGSGPLALMVHGFPESWYSWRHQIGPIAAAGFTAAAMDVRGYGGSSKFDGVPDFRMEALIGDILGVGAALSPDSPFVLIGHDWGAPQVWNTSLIHPDRIAAVAAMSVPYFGVPQVSFDLVIKQVWDDKNKFFYQSYFREPGRAEAAFEAEPRRFLKGFYHSISGEAKTGDFPVGQPSDFPLLEGLNPPETIGAWMSEEDLDYYTSEFTASGFFGPLSRYRNHTRDWEFLLPYKDRKIEQPACFIAGDKDPAYSGFGMIEDPIGRMRSVVPNLETALVLPGCGHWTQQERPAEVNAALIPWLTSLKGRAL